MMCVFSQFLSILSAVFLLLPCDIRPIKITRCSSTSTASSFSGRSTRASHSEDHKKAPGLPYVIAMTTGSLPASVRWVTAAALKDKRLTHTEHSYRQKLCTGLTTTYLPSPCPSPRFNVGYRRHHAHYINTGRKPADLWSNSSPPWYHRHSWYVYFPLDSPHRALHIPWIPLLECKKRAIVIKLGFG